MKIFWYTLIRWYKTSNEIIIPRNIFFRLPFIFYIILLFVNLMLISYNHGTIFFLWMLYLCAHKTRLCVFGVTLNCLWWWGSSFRALRSAESSLLPLLLGSLRQRVVVHVRVWSRDQIDVCILFILGIAETI